MGCGNPNNFNCFFGTNIKALASAWGSEKKKKKNPNRKNPNDLVLPVPI